MQRLTLAVAGVIGDGQRSQLEAWKAQREAAMRAADGAA